MEDMGDKRVKERDPQSRKPVTLERNMVNWLTKQPINEWRCSDNPLLLPAMTQHA
jgi:hypothetical protein